MTSCATDLLFLPIIFSPITDAVSKFKPETKVNLSKTGTLLSKDSYTAITSTASG